MFVAGQSQPNVRVPPPKDLREIQGNRMLVCALRRMLEDGHVKTPFLESKFDLPTQVIGRRLSPYAEQTRTATGTQWTLRPGIAAPSEEEIEAMCSPEDVCVEQASLAASERLQRVHGIKCSETLDERMMAAYATFDDDDPLKPMVRAVIDRIQTAPWNETAAWLDAVAGKTGLGLDGLGDPSAGGGYGFARRSVTANPAQATALMQRASVMFTEQMRRLGAPRPVVSQDYGGDDEEGEEDLAHASALDALTATLESDMLERNRRVQDQHRARRRALGQLDATAEALHSLKDHGTGGSDARGVGEQSEGEDVFTGVPFAPEEVSGILAIRRTRKVDGKYVVDTVTDPKEMARLLRRERVQSSASAARGRGEDDGSESATTGGTRPKTLCAACGQSGHQRTSKQCMMFGQDLVWEFKRLNGRVVRQRVGQKSARELSQAKKEEDRARRRAEEEHRRELEELRESQRLTASSTLDATQTLDDGGLASSSSIPESVSAYAAAVRAARDAAEAGGGIVVESSLRRTAPRPQPAQAEVAAPAPAPVAPRVAPTPPRASVPTPPAAAGATSALPVSQVDSAAQRLALELRERANFVHDCVEQAASGYMQVTNATWQVASNPAYYSEQRVRRLNGLIASVSQLYRRKFGLFAEPVTPEQAPDYRQLIATPMDLGTVRERAKAGQYESLAQFLTHLDQIVCNCVVYHSYPGKMPQLIPIAHSLQKQVVRSALEHRDATQVPLVGGGSSAQLVAALHATAVQADGLARDAEVRAGMAPPPTRSAPVTITIPGAQVAPPAAASTATPTSSASAVSAAGPDPAVAQAPASAAGTDGTGMTGSTASMDVDVDLLGDLDDLFGDGVL
uniref:Bromo domain-containing protein n=1 Tax=Sexangularia sp. CB-2014 TaxID=1486929 RepID=A0A7S1YGK0_9EUKA